MEGFKLYKKKAAQPMKPWQPGMDMSMVSVSDADRENGSPKEGDMIAINPDNETDMWLVSKKYFEENYAPA